ncbi:porin [Vibrio sp. ZSDZ65]|uniref:Porin n=1 Tax=Vibrio qingdaonensis TaxID=2829491 RepID=A0A9X3CLQ0_9VIBR|nr:porin [Vibrio qingdaonensis]MCW8345717.1 porin [Vibrio qingdaonensis]
MKMAAIAAAITTTLVSGSALAAEVYNSDGTSLGVGGRVEFRGDFLGRSSGSKLDGTMDNQSRVRINIDAKTKINDDLSGLGFYEAEQSANSSGDNDKGTNGITFKQRYLFAGLETNGNTVTFGRQDTAGVQISQMSDKTTYTGAQKEFISSGNEQINNTIAYSGYFMDALSVKASYIAGDGKNTDGYGISGIYTLPFGLGVGLGYSGNGLGETGGGVDKGDGNQVIAGLNYTFGGLYVAGTYTQGSGADTNKDKDFTGYEFAAIYSFENGFDVLGAYQKGELDDGTTKVDKSNFYELTGRYRFNSSIHTYLSYKMNNLKAGEFNDSTTGAASTYDAENSMRLGVRYDF